MIKKPLIIIISFMLLHCSQPDYIAEAKLAMQNKNYSQAIKLWEKAVTRENYDDSNNQNIAVAYMLNGLDIYNKSKNVRSFIENFESGQNYIPSKTDTIFKKLYSDLLFELGKVLNDTRVKTTLEQEEIFNLSVKLLKESLNQDSTNSNSDSLLKKIKAKHFIVLMQKGEGYLNRAEKYGNPNYYTAAESFFRRALELDEGNITLLLYLEKIKTKSISILNLRDGLALAINKYDYQDTDFVINVVVKNYLTEEVDLKLSNFKLVDKEGTEYFIFTKGMKTREQNNEKVLSDLTLSPKHEEIDGILVFNLPNNPELSHLSYQIKRNKESKKYFP